MGGKVIRCKYCRGTSVVKNGTRGGVPYWSCRSCGHSFVDNRAVPGMRYPAETVAGALTGYYRGLSLQAISGEIRNNTGRKPSASTVLGWVRNFTLLALSEAGKHFPRVGDTWIIVVTTVFIAHRMYLCIAVLDSQTGFLLASRLGKFKDMRTVLEASAETAGRYPARILTDGWRGYGNLIEQVFGADAAHVVIHPRERQQISAGYVDSAARWRNILRIRYKSVRRPDENVQTELGGLALCYNFFVSQGNREHSTPAEAAGIRFPFRNWLDVVRASTDLRLTTARLRE